MEGLYAQVIAHKAIGDNSGRLTLRRGQVYYSTQSRVVQEYSILAQRLSGVALPLLVNCRGVDVKLKGINWATTRENLSLQGFANNKGADQPAHPHSLISALVISCLESVISRLATSEITVF